MRITFRSKNNRDYWKERWMQISADSPMENDEKYPLKYSKLLIGDDSDGRILEAGCGAGRILRYYKNRGYRIIGIDFINEAIEKLRLVDPELEVEQGDIQNLRFEDDFFDYVLAFGLYHNLETGLVKAVDETRRVLKPGGWLCASFRADNIQTRLVDWLAQRNDVGSSNLKREFHKANLTKDEFFDLFESNGFRVKSIYPVENMPIFYKFSIFRAKEHRKFNESLGRREGYRLTRCGDILQNMLKKYFPHHFCNIYVILAQKTYE